MQLCHWIGMVIDPQIDQHVIHPAIAALLAHHIKRGGLAPAAIATGRVACGQSLQQPIRQSAVRRFESTRHRKDDLLPDQDVSLTGEATPYLMAGPAMTTRAGMSRG